MKAAQITAAVVALCREFLANIRNAATAATVLPLYQDKFRDLLRQAKDVRRDGESQDALREFDAAVTMAADIEDQTPKHIPSLLDRVEKYLGTRTASVTVSGVRMSWSVGRILVGVAGVVVAFFIGRELWKASK